LQSVDATKLHVFRSTELINGSGEPLSDLPRLGDAKLLITGLDGVKQLLSADP